MCVHSTATLPTDSSSGNIQGQPPSASFERIVQAIGLYDHWIDVQQVTPVEAEQWGQHAVQAYVWGLIGKHLFCVRIACLRGSQKIRLRSCCGSGRKHRHCVY